MEKILTLTLLVLNTFNGILFAQTAKVTEYKKTFTTYPYSDPNPVPTFSKMYPYFRFDGFTEKPIQKEWKVVQLENDYITVMILPEIGGKIWAAIEKSTNRPFIYYNHVVKFRDVAMRGPWTSGGIEANYGIMGHTPNCATPVDYITRSNADGSVSCIIGVQDLLTHTNWRIEINLPKDKAYFTTKSFWYNNSGIHQPYYHWMNAGIKSSGNLEYIYPGNKYLGHDGDFADWPTNPANSKWISFYEQNNFGGYKSYHVFGHYANFFGGYWHDEDFGMARFSSYDDKPGRKIWIWGLSQQGMIWEKLLTDNDGQYTEIQSGRLFNQNSEKSSLTPFKHISFTPYTTDRWTEYWYPVMHTRGFVEANEYGALNVMQENGWIKIYLSPVTALADSLKITDGNTTIYKKYITAKPLQTFRDSIKISAGTGGLQVTLGENKLCYNSSKSQALDRPVKSPSSFNWESAYGLYVAGKELMDQRMYKDAEIKLLASVGKDSNFLPAIAKLAELYYCDLRFLDAVNFAKKALSIDTYDPTANYYYGLTNVQLNNVVDAKDGFDLAALSTEYRCAAYTELAKLYLKSGDLQNCLTYANKSIDFNRYNVMAYQYKAIVSRLLAQKNNAEAALDSILSFDALNHFARFEKYLWQNSEDNRLAFLNSITNEQPRETFLELAITYFNTGQFEEAEKVLSLCPSNGFVDYWIAYLRYLQGKDTREYIDRAIKASPAFIFPSRLESANMLAWAREQTSDWKPKYWLALILGDKNRLQESKQLFDSIGEEPAYAPFYAARANLKKEEQPASAIADLKKAMQIDSSEWRYPKSLAEIYIQQNNFQSALEITSRYYSLHPVNYIFGMLHAKVLLLNKQYLPARQLLSTIHIIPFEGATIGHELQKEANLMLALEYIRTKNFRKALSFIEVARSWPFNLGSGKPYQEDIDERLEDWLSYYCLSRLGKPSQAKQSLEKILSFSSKTKNGGNNYFSANDLISAWAIEKLESKEDADRWIDDQLSKSSGDKHLSWARNKYYQDNYSMPDSEKDATIRVIEQWLSFAGNI